MAHNSMKGSSGDCAANEHNYHSQNLTMFNL